MLLKKIEVLRDTSEVRLARGEELRLSLRIGATGRLWGMNALGDVAVTDLGVSSSGSFGGAGLQSFIVVCQNPGDYPLELVLRAPWRNEIDEKRELILRVR